MAKRYGRQQGQALPLALSLLALALALALLLFNVVFVVRGVEIVGAGDLSDQEVLRMSGIRLGARLNAVNEDYVRANVEEDGRLAFVSLEHRFPDRLVLTVRRRTRDALFLQAGKVLVLDSDGYVVEIVDRLPDEGIPYVSGLRPSGYAQGRQLDTSDGRVGCMKAILDALKAQNAIHYVAEISVENTAALRLLTRTGMLVTLGNVDNMDHKIIWMAGTLADLQARGETSGQLDVASGNKADYTPPKPTATPEPEPTVDPVIAEYGVVGS